MVRALGGSRLGFDDVVNDASDRFRIAGGEITYPMKTQSCRGNDGFLKRMEALVFFEVVFKLGI